MTVKHYKTESIMIFVTDTTPLYHIGFIWSGDKKRMQQDATKQQMKLLQCKNVSMSPPHKIHRGLIIKLYLISWWLVAVLGRIQDVVHCFIRYLPSYPPHTVIQHTLLQRSHFSIINNIHFLMKRRWISSIWFVWFYVTLVCCHLSEKCI